MLIRQSERDFFIRAWCVCWQLQLLSEDLVLLLRNAGWGGRKSCHERRRGALRERRRWELDDGDDGCVGEHYGVGGFDHLPEDDFLYGEGDGF